MYLDANFRSLRISGTTADGVPVIAGLFPVVNSEGVALDMLLEGGAYAAGWLRSAEAMVQTLLRVRVTHG